MTEFDSCEQRARWLQADELFARALELPATERAAFLRAQTGADGALFERVNTLLDSAARTDDLLESPTRLLAGPLAELLAQCPEPDIIQLGAFRVTDRIGSGGGGTVYRAERADGAFEQRVAIKILRHGLHTRDARRRFRAERQILASLDHPHIARLLDGGATPDGRPYMVMEYVDGLPITDYCDQHRLSVRGRLRLFAQVVRAVEHAHRNLVVHCDIKPSNILVTPDGTPRLLDFGIASLLDHTHGDDDAIEPRALTPAYASPEQVRGERVTTATDVYQLGALLYLLLTGRRPVADRLHARRSRADTAPPPPSAVVGHRPGDNADGDARRVAGLRRSDPLRLRRALLGDLDAMVLSCLRLQPASRYVSAAALAQDVEHHLASRPVAARPATFGYRASRFLARRSGSSLVAAVMLAATVFYVMSVRQYADLLHRERDRSQGAVVEARFAQQRIQAALIAAREAQAAAEAARRLAETQSQRAAFDRDHARAEERRAGQVVEAVLALLELRQTDARGDTLNTVALHARDLLRALALQRARQPVDHEAVAASLHKLSLIMRELDEPQPR
jgi:eukaryotic-like serine/threonine-protein kinase